MKLLTDGHEKNPLWAFCLTTISKHGQNWPPTEETLAMEFVDWLGLEILVSRNGLKELCQAKGVDLSFATLPQEIVGFNCSFHNKKEIVIAERELAPFADSHTLLHEFRELLEQELVGLGHPTIGANDSLEVQAEIFAMAGRFKMGERQFPVFLETASKVEKKWARYLSYAFVCFSMFAYLFSCIYMRQLEEVGSQAHH